MSLEVNGTIEKVLTIEKGTTKDGKEWQKQLYIVANNDGYEGKKQIFCFEVFGEEKVQNFNKFNKVGDSVKVEFNISTNEWNGKYFTSLQSWKVTKNESVQASVQPFETVTDLNELEDDGLPF